VIEIGNVAIAPPLVRSSRTAHLHRFAWTIVLTGFAVVPVVAENWPQFRGLQGGVAADHPSLPSAWSRTQNVVWKAAVPGRSWSSPVVWGDHVFVTTVVNVSAPDQPLKPVSEYRGRSWNGPLDEKSIVSTPDAHRWVLYDFELSSGRVRWERVLHTAVPSEPVHQKNTYFSETPVTDGARVYVYSASIGLFAFDMSGNPVWSKPMPAVKTRMGWGGAASPALHQGRLYVVNDNEERSYLAAYDAPSGRELWRVERDERTNWSTPLVWEHELRTEIVTTGTGRVRSYDLDGRPLWDIKRMSVLTVPSPLARHGLLFVSAGYIGVPFDTPIVGYRVSTINVLRLWKAEATESFDFSAFNVGDYYRAVAQKVDSENLTKILYPNDGAARGKQLRLEQQYFFISCSLQDMIRIQLESGGSLATLDRAFAAQLNDTHPSIAVAELMRLLVDDHGVAWETAWALTERTLSYTNHTLLPEALEQWPMPLFAQVLPRHLEIIFEINRRFLDEVRRRYPGDEARVARLSIIGESGTKSVRMAHLASVGCHTINGVAELHTSLLKRDLLRDFDELWPQKFVNVTNGVTPRRWVLLASPSLAALITAAIGDRWVEEGDALGQLEAHADDPAFCDAWRRVKRENRSRLSDRALKQHGIRLDPDSLFDVQVKRIHEYKRQHLNVLHVITLYNRLRRQPLLDVPPRTVIFAGKAAPGYFMAKLIIRLINGVAEAVNQDPAVAGRLTVAFLPDFNVTNSQPIYPAADLSEQISTAGKEASGTGNMKFAMNGALTIGTLDGANVEIRDRVGPDNFFKFGLTVDEVAEVNARGRTPWKHYEANGELREAIDQIRAGRFSRGDVALFEPLVRALLDRDEYLALEDYEDYVACQDAVNAAYRDAGQWTRMSILNVARTGSFSSDRAIRQYAEKIWRVVPVHVTL
jgi:starch phosphorylase